MCYGIAVIRYQLLNILSDQGGSDPKLSSHGIGKLMQTFPWECRGVGLINNLWRENKKLVQIKVTEHELQAVGRQKEQWEHLR